MIDTSRPVLDDDGCRIERRASAPPAPAAVLPREDSAPRGDVPGVVPGSVPCLVKPVRVGGFVNSLNLALESIQIPE